MKKVLSVILVVVLLASIMSVTAFAYGGHCGGGSKRALNQQRCTLLCTVSDCDIVGAHQHNGVWYCSHDGQCTYDICSVQGCTELGLHEHNGVLYRCINYGTGYGRCRGNW